MKKRMILLIIFLFLIIPSNAFAYTKKVLVIEIDPYLTTKGKKTSVFLNQSDNVNTMISNLKNDIAYGSNNNVNVEIVGREYLNEFPTYTRQVTLSDGTKSYRFDEERYLSVFNNGWYGWWNSGDPDFEMLNKGFFFDYEYFINKFDLVNRRNKNEFNEVWIIGIDPLSAYETVMIGNNPYWVNGKAIYKNCPNFIMSGFTISRVDTSLECLGHASEQIMKKVFTQSYDTYKKGQTVNKNNLNLWELFSASTFNFGFSEVGTVHHAPNSIKDYDWSNTNYVSSSWIDWKNNYPNLNGQTVNTNYKTWNPSNDAYYAGRYYHRWWFSLMPHITGRTEDGYSNNWWDYLFTLDFVKSLTNNSSNYTYIVGDRINDLKFKRLYNSNTSNNYTVIGNEKNVRIVDKSIINYVDGNLKALKAGTTTVNCCFDGKCVSTMVTVKENESPTIPVITGGSNDWTSGDRTISIQTFSNQASGIKNYEYYMSNSEKELIGGKWITFTNSIKISKSGEYYIFVRALDNNGNYSDISVPQKVKIDNLLPTKPKLEIMSKKNDLTNLSIKEESTSLSGIKEYQYYISTSSKEPMNGKWIKTNKSFSIISKEKCYVFVRGISNTLVFGEISDVLEIEYKTNSIDNEKEKDNEKDNEHLLFNSLKIKNNNLFVSENNNKYEITINTSSIEFDIDVVDDVTYEIIGNENLINNSLVSIKFKRDNEIYNYDFIIHKKINNKAIIFIILSLIFTIVLSIIFIKKYITRKNI